jgi:hypothetical protein
MFTRPATLETAGLRAARVDALKVLADLDPTDADYEKTLNAVETLSKLIAEEQPESLNINTVLLALTNIGGIATIVWHEREHVMASKALSFIGKLR